MKSLWKKIWAFINEAYIIHEQVEAQKYETYKTFYLLSHKF